MRILATVVRDREKNKREYKKIETLGNWRPREALTKDQCTYYKEKGH